MAEYRNVSGVARHLALPDWPMPRLVEVDGVVFVEDDIAAQYAFDQPGVWEDTKSKRKTPSGEVGVVDPAVLPTKTDGE